MKKLLASGALVVAALFTFQPATAADLAPEPAPTAAVEQTVTATDALVNFEKPAVETSPAPAPEPVEDVAVLVSEPAPAPASTETVVTAEPVLVEPSPVTVTVTEPSPEPAPPTTTQVIHEDSPEWDCATMGNFICGLDEAKALWKATGSTTDFHMVYLGLTPVGPTREGYEYIPSVINPAYHYVFFKVG